MVTRKTDATNDDTLYLLGGAAVLAVLGVGGVWVSLHTAAVITGAPSPRRDPLRLVVDLITGRQGWPVSATVVAVVLAVILAGLTCALILMWPKKKHPKKRPDRAVPHMAKRDDLAHLTKAGAVAKAARLGCSPVAITAGGVPFGATVPGRQMLFGSFEDMLIMVAGPRTQKTTAYAVPAVLEAPGAVLATSNKRDVKDATIALRALLGHVDVFDPQGVASTQQAMWWNPLSYVNGSETRAEKLAGQFVKSTRPDGARTDAYFDGEAENLIGLLILAAALDGHPITRIYSWLTKPTNDAPSLILERHGFELQAESLYALATLPDKQREGVYGTARSLMGFLRNRQIVSWVTQQPTMREFDPHTFARSSDTLYALSREGEGSVGPIVAAITMALLDALEEAATASPGGRLAVPFVGVLDEAANICKLRNLDAHYSHYGSRGLILFTILQSWAQGCDVWGDRGMEKLWSSANVKLYGGGVDDERFLTRLSNLIGSAETVQRTQSVTKGVRTVSRSIVEKPILSVAELRELPQGRAVAFASGTPAVLVEPQPWYLSPNADAVNASIKENSPA